MPQLCLELTTKLDSLKQLKQEFDLEFIKIKKLDSKKSDDLIFIRETKIKLEQSLAEFQDLFWPFEKTELNWQNFEAQYENQVGILMEANLLDSFSNGKQGIKAIDNREYPLPTLEQIREKFVEKRELLKTKIDQGFVKLVIVPFGLPLDYLTKAYGDALTRHQQQGELLDSQNRPLKLDKEAVGLNSDYIKADGEGRLVYFLKDFLIDPIQGLTKETLLNTQAWQVLLLEDLPYLPAEGKGQIRAGRKQLEANQIPSRYLKQLQLDPQYQDEQGLTPESWLMYALNHLEQTNQVIDDWNDQGKICLLVNSFIYFKSDDSVPGGVPRACFESSPYQAALDWFNPVGSGANFGVRTAVSVF
ncbi:MAG: hypothetical protein WCW02_02350 [Candidatus Buchananbacteria bacterium]